MLQSYFAVVSKLSFSLLFWGNLAFAHTTDFNLLNYNPQSVTIDHFGDNLPAHVPSQAKTYVRVVLDSSILASRSVRMGVAGDSPPNTTAFLTGLTDVVEKAVCGSESNVVYIKNVRARTSVRDEFTVAGNPYYHLAQSEIPCQSSAVTESRSCDNSSNWDELGPQKLLKSLAIAQWGHELDFDFVVGCKASKDSALVSTKENKVARLQVGNDAYELSISVPEPTRVAHVNLDKSVLKHTASQIVVLDSDDFYTLPLDLYIPGIESFLKQELCGLERSFVSLRREPVFNAYGAIGKSSRRTDQMTLFRAGGSDAWTLYLAIYKLPQSKQKEKLFDRIFIRNSDVFESSKNSLTLWLAGSCK